MEGLARLVAESMARLGIEPQVDHRRLQWSRWSRLESSFDLCLVPSRPGLFAIAEEIVAPGELPVGGGKRMLAVLEVRETGDLGVGMSRLFAPASLLRERISDGRVFVRFTVIEDDSQRTSALASLQRWLAQSTETATGITSDLNFQSESEPASSARGSASSSESESVERTSGVESSTACQPGAHAVGLGVKDPSPIPAGF